MYFDFDSLFKQKLVWTAGGALLLVGAGFQNCSHGQMNPAPVTARDASNLSTQSISPLAASITVNMTQALSAENVSDGAQVKFVLVSGEGNVGAASGLYTAPNKETVATIGLQINGVLSKTATTTITVVGTSENLILSPSAATMAIGDAPLQLSASGGQGPYQYSLQSSSTPASGSVDAKGLFTATGLGNSSLQVTDQYGVSSQTSTVTVIPAVLCASADETNVASMSCPGGTMVRSIDFASFGTPTGDCTHLTVGTCSSANSLSVVSNSCLGENSCAVQATNDQFGGDPCSGIHKNLAIRVVCAPSAGASEQSGKFFHILKDEKGSSPRSAEKP